jgi:hypothetical protein
VQVTGEREEYLAGTGAVQRDSRPYRLNESQRMLGLDAQDDQPLVAVADDEVDGLSCGRRQSLQQRHRLVETEGALGRSSEQKGRGPQPISFGLGVLHDVSRGNQRAQDPVGRACVQFQCPRKLDDSDIAARVAQHGQHGQCPCDCLRPGDLIVSGRLLHRAHACPLPRMVTAI